MKTIISVQNLELGNAVVFDCRSTLMAPEQGRLDYDAGHIPGALFADLDVYLSSEPGPRGRHPLPDPQTLAAFMRSMGVNDDTTVVCYDQNAGAFAARLWWLLRWLGHEDVAVLDGGLDAWLEAGGELVTSEQTPIPGNFSIRTSLTRTCEADRLPSDEVKLLDARDEARFRGEVEPIDKVAGHIPGAVCLPFVGNLTDGKFKSPEALRERFGDLDDQSACYCGSGVTATHNILAICIAGLPEPMLYPGSWSEWVEDPARPIATGDE